MLIDIYLNYKECCLLLIEHFYECKDVYQYLTNMNPYIVILTDTYHSHKKQKELGTQIFLLYVFGMPRIT